MQKNIEKTLHDLMAWLRRTESFLTAKSEARLSLENVDSDVQDIRVGICLYTHNTRMIFVHLDKDCISVLFKRYFRADSWNINTDYWKEVK